METIIAKTFAMFLLMSNHQWEMFLPMQHEFNSMAACQESGKNVLKTTTDNSIIAVFCSPLTVEQIANFQPQNRHEEHHKNKPKDEVDI